MLAGLAPESGQFPKIHNTTPEVEGSKGISTLREETSCSNAEPLASKVEFC